MVSSLFLDANVLLDLTLHRQGFKSTNAIIQAGINGSVQLYTTPAVLHVTAYYTKKHFPINETKQIFLRLLTQVNIIDCDHTTALISINSNMDDIEDALQYYTALKHELGYFISSDKKLKKAAIPQLPVYSADELLAELESDQ